MIQTAQTGECDFGELVDIDKPNVDSNGVTDGDSFGVTSTNCVNWSFQVQLYNGALGNKPVPSSQLQDSPSACLSAIGSDPIPQDDPAVPGDSFCVKSTDGFLAYVTIKSVDSQGDATLQLNGWSTNGSVAGSGPAGNGSYTATYPSQKLVIQTMQQGECDFGELVNIDKPNVDSNGVTDGDSFGVTSTNCVNWSFQVQLYNGALGTKPLPSSQLQDSPSACLGLIDSDPIPQDDPAVPGDSFCVKSTDGNLAYVTIKSIDSQGDATLQLNGWSAG